MRPRASLLAPTFASVLCAGLLQPSPAAAQTSGSRVSAPSLVLTGVNILEGPELRPRYDVTVVVEDGLIRRIGASDVPAP